MKDMTWSYDAVKEFEGRKYTGMRVGGKHSWYYREGEWEETKVAPDKWRFTYSVKKRRKEDAPEGSGVPTGTEYHWYLLAHQTVRKIDANEYTTSMTGVKYKLAHRRAGNENWSAGGQGQLRKLIAILEENIALLRRELRDGGELGMVQSGTDSPMGSNQRRTEMVGARKLMPSILTPGVLRQPPLETYILQTGVAGAETTDLPSGVSGSSSSKSEFFPKNNR